MMTTSLKRRMAITLLRAQLSSLHTQEHALLTGVHHHELDDALGQLDELIDLDEIKTQITQQIQLLLLNRSDDHMLHTIIAGAPGSGKTTLALILARIWGALGIIHRSLPAEEVEVSVEQLLREREADQSWHEYILYRQSQILREVRHQIFQLNPRRRGNDAYALWQRALKSVTAIRSLTREALQEQKKTSPKSSTLKITVARRDDLVAGYVGQTALKTKKVLDDARGGVLLIDEAYSLCMKENGSRDSFGEECLTLINEYMSLYPRELIVIFAGYEEKLNNLFEVQPGLRRRFAHYFRMPTYNITPLARIFRQQLARKGWHLRPEVPVEQLLKEHSSLLVDGGGATEKLALLCKLAYAKIQWEGAVQGNEHTHERVISAEMLSEALRSWTLPQTSSAPLSMYL